MQPKAATDAEHVEAMLAAPDLYMVPHHFAVEDGGCNQPGVCARCSFELLARAFKSQGSKLPTWTKGRPSHSGLYLAYFPKTELYEAGIETMYYSTNGDERDRWQHRHSPTHWMPLPEPPK
jgi:hypothetical protein